MEQSQHNPGRWIPDGSHEISRPGLGVVYIHSGPDGSVAAIAYLGNLTRCAFHRTFASIAERDEMIAEFFMCAAEGYEAEPVKAMEPKKASHDYLVDDIVVYTWGWEQTNVDFHQVIGVTKKGVRLRRIEADVVSTGSMHGTCTPRPLEFTQAPPTTKRVRPDGGITMPHGSAYKWDGTPRRWSS